MNALSDRPFGVRPDGPLAGAFEFHTRWRKPLAPGFVLESDSSSPRLVRPFANSGWNMPTAPGFGLRAHQFPELVTRALLTGPRHGDSWITIYVLHEDAWRFHRSAKPATLFGQSPLALASLFRRREKPSPTECRPYGRGTPAVPSPARLSRSHPRW